MENQIKAANRESRRLNKAAKRAEGRKGQGNKLRSAQRRAKSASRDLSQLS